MHDSNTPGAQRSRAVVRHASLSDLDTVMPAYSAAVYDEAVASWILPDGERRRQLAETAEFGQYVRTLLESGVLVVAETDGIAGISVWLRVDDSSTDVADESSKADEQALLREIYGEYADRVWQVGALTTQQHPHGHPYFYLQQMAVLPTHRGDGLGGSMLRYGIAVADAEGVPVHLEASTPRNRALYARHGFVDAGAPVELPEEGPRIQPMYRDPR